MPRRPIKHKLESAVQRFLNANKTGTGFASVPMLNSYGYAIGDNTAVPKVQPPFPFVTIMASTTADAEIPGVASYNLEIVYHTDSTLTPAQRITATETIEEIHRLMTQPPDDAATWSDGNREGGAFKAYANKPNTGTDTRDASAKPLHVYDIMPESDATQLAQGEHTWNDTLSYTGTAQTMDNQGDA